MHVGRWIGNPCGPDRPTAVYVEPSVDVPGRPLLSWTPAHTHAAFGTYYKVVVDGLEVGRTAEAELPVPTDARDHIEVWECSPAAIDDPLTFCAASAEDRIRLTWAEVGQSPARYELYRSLTSGNYPDPPLSRFDAGQTSYTFIDGPLPDDTYYYKIVALDTVGNEQASSELEATISAAPDPPSNLSFTHDDVSGETTLTWTASPSADVAGYNIYKGTDRAELTGTPIDAGNETSYVDDNSSTSGRIVYVLRAYDGEGNEEAGLACMITIDLTDGDQVSRPNSPTILSARAIPGGEAEVTATYSRAGEVGIATEIRLYGGEGSVSWETPLDTAVLTAGQSRQTITLETTTLSGGTTYLLAVRAATAGDVEDTNTATESVTTDATAPAQPDPSIAVI